VKLRVRPKTKWILAADGVVWMGLRSQRELAPGPGGIEEGHHHFAISE
jgi:hypothetical protein